MKPWEETWVAEGDPTVPGAAFTVVFTFQDGNDRDRMRLASAAPDLVRVLLGIEWSWRERSEHLRCPECDGDGPPRKGEPHLGHAPSCALDAALRKAGVR